MSGNRRILAHADVSLFDIISTTFWSCSRDGENPTFGIVWPLSASKVILTLHRYYNQNLTIILNSLRSYKFYLPEQWVRTRFSVTIYGFRNFVKRHFHIHPEGILQKLIDSLSIFDPLLVNFWTVPLENLKENVVICRRHVFRKSIQVPKTLLKN